MICARHDWWEVTPCPKCDPAPPPAIATETVTVAVTPETDLVSGELNPGSEPGPLFDDPALDIPDFLLRNKDGSFAHPELMVHDVRDAVPRPDAPVLHTPEVRPVEAQTDTELYLALDDPELSLVDRQPIYQELRAREDKKKSYARIEKLKSSKKTKET